MCGIAGIISPEDSIESARAKAILMSKALSHRGPDTHANWAEEAQRLVLAHRRLSIQDLSQDGNQPMHSHSGNLTIVFNGEIYNFQSLASELRSKGVIFKSQSDTEVLLAAIEYWGLEKSLSKCKGAFAFALWDHSSKYLHLVRDPIGEKPLYFGVTGQQFLFASELKALFAIANPQQLEIDFDAMGSYLRYGYISAPNSIFKSIKKLAPGTFLSIPVADLKSASSLKQYISTPNNFQKYWSVHEVQQQNQNQIIYNETQATDSLDDLLNKIIKEQAISDVPLGSFLSGGIDSSLVSALLQNNSSRPVDTFTIGFHEKSFNEAIHAKNVARHIGSNHHELYLNSADALDMVPKLSSVYDEPFADSSQIPTLLVCQMAKKNVSVCLSGDGGDELFAGYNRYSMTENMYSKGQALPAPIRRMTSSFLTSIPPKYWDLAYSLLIKIFRKTGSANIGLKIHKLGELFKHDSLESVYRYLSGYWQEPESLLINNINEPALTTHSNFEDKFLQSAMLWDQDWYLPGDNLVKSDRASMANSLEMRLPLLDKELIDFSWQIPNSMKLKDNQTKWLLRQVLYRYVPQDLIDRPKMGFSVPIASWIRKDLKEWSEDLLSYDNLSKQEIFDPQLIRKTYNQHLSGKYDHSHKLWTVLMFQSWYRNYIG